MITELLSINIKYIALTIIGIYFAFYKFTSDSWVKEFGIWNDEKIQPLTEMKNAVSRLVYTHTLRSILLLLFGNITIFLLLKDKGGIQFIQTSSIYRTSVIALSIWLFLWCFIFGPRRLAREYKTKQNQTKPNYKEHIRPYIFDLPTIAAPVIILAPLIGGSVILVAINDCQNFISINNVILHSVQTMQLDNVLNLQNNLIQMVDFGLDLANHSQKYIAVGVIWYIYAIAEQRTSMSKTMIPLSVEVLKFTLVILLLIIFITGLGILPYYYSELFTSFQTVFFENIEKLTTMETAPIILDMQYYLENHNIKWYYLEVITGYGNILALGIITFGIGTRRLFFREASVREILSFFLSGWVVIFLIKVLRQVGIDFDQAPKRNHI